MFFAILSLHVAWASYFMKMPTGSNSNSILKQELQSKMQQKQVLNQNQNQPKNIILPYQLQKFHSLAYLLRRSQYQKVITTQLHIFTVKNLHNPLKNIILISSKQDTKQRMQSVLRILIIFKKGGENLLERLIQLRPRLLLLVMHLSKDIFLLVMVQEKKTKEVRHRRNIGFQNKSPTVDRTLKSRVVANNTSDSYIQID